MKQLLKLTFFSFLIIIIIYASPSLTYADEATEEMTPSEKELLTDGMCINSLDLNVIVNKDGTLDIEENITAYYLQEADYLVKTIPLEYNKIYNTTTYSRYGNVSNLKVNTKYKKSYTTDLKGSTSLVLKFPNPNKDVAGEHKIKLSYTYNLLSKPLDEIDELFFDIIDRTSAYHIGKITFSIKLPKKFNANNIKFTNSSVNSLENKLKSKVNGNTITGSCNTVIYPRTGLTIQLNLEKNYFNFKKEQSIIVDLLIIILAIVGFITTYILWHNSNKSIEITESLTYYPPKGFNNAEVSLMYNGSAKSIDIAALIVYLANKGYIAVIEKDSKKRHYSYKILRPYNGNNVIEKMLLDGLSKYANEENYISISDIKDNFFDIQHNIISYLKESNIHKNMYLKNNTPIIVGFVSILLSLLPVYLIPGYYGMKLGSILPALAIIVITGLLLLANKIFVKSTTIKSIISCLIIGIGYLIIASSNIMPCGMIYRAKPIYSFFIPIALLFAMLTGIIFSITSKRNKFGSTMLTQLETLKDNLFKSTKIDLIALVQDNPNYFYDMLPYTYTLNISNQWLDNFSKLDIEAPSWYISESEFKISVFNSKINRTLLSTSEAMSSIPQSMKGSKKYLK